MSKIKVGLAGTGYWGKNLFRNFLELGALGAVCDTNPKTLEQFCSQAKGAKGYATFDEMIEDKSLQGVVLATPAVTHYALAKKALLKGKDVFVEKPLALNIKEGAELVKIAEEHKRILMVGHVLEYHPAFLKIREIISSGGIGQVRYFYSNRLNFGKVRREENILWSFAPHDIAVILRIIGEMPQQVIALGGAYIQPNVADVTVTQLLFDHGVAAHIFISWLNPFKEQKLVIVGSEKMIMFNDVSKELILYDLHVEVQGGEPIPIKGEGTKIAYAADEPLGLECQAYLKAIETRKPALTDGVSGLRVLEVLHAAQRSLNLQGQPIIMADKVYG
jgi:predicted dehydrogenase